LNNEAVSLTDYYERDLMALNIPSEDPLSFVGDQTANILKPLEQSTTILPVSTIIWPTEDTPSKNTTQSFAQFWGKRGHESEPTNMEFRHVKEEKPYFSPSSAFGKPKEELHIDSKTITNSGKQKKKKVNNRREISKEKTTDSSGIKTLQTTSKSFRDSTFRAFRYIGKREKCFGSREKSC